MVEPGPAISPMLYGLMTEEINHSYDGGLYAELIRNRDFKEADKKDPTKPAPRVPSPMPSANLAECALLFRPTPSCRRRGRRGQAPAYSSAVSEMSLLV